MGDGARDMARGWTPHEDKPTRTIQAEPVTSTLFEQNLATLELANTVAYFLGLKPQDEIPFAVLTDRLNALMEKEKTRNNKREEFFKAVEAELDKARAKHGTNQWNRHEFHSILEEEFEEVWDDIKKHAPSEQLLKEVFQVVACCLHYFETGDSRLGDHPSIKQINKFFQDPKTTNATD